MKPVQILTLVFGVMNRGVLMNLPSIAPKSCLSYPAFKGLFLLAVFAFFAPSAYALNGGTLRINTYNGWTAFEVISAGDDPAGDGFNYFMMTHFDGLGAWLVTPSTLRIQVNHETPDASISEVNLDLAALETAIDNMISSGNTGGVNFVNSARQAYDRWSSDGGLNWTNTSDVLTTSFSRFCSGQSYATNTFGTDRGFVDEIYITGEEGDSKRLFAIDNVNRDLYQLSGIVGNASGGFGGMSFDSFENAALVDTGEIDHVALLLSPDGGTQRMHMYIGEKGKDSVGNSSSSFLARNGLAYGSWYYLIGSFPSGTPTSGGFSTSFAAALDSTKLEDVDTSPSDPTQVVLGDQDSGVFTFAFNLDFGSGSFNAGTSSFTITKIVNHGVSGNNIFNSPDNVDWTNTTTLNGTDYPDGLIFTNEDSGEGEIWVMNPDGSNQVRTASTNVGAESTGILDISEMVGYEPGSILITNNQGTPASMSVMINPDATLFCFTMEHFSEMSATWLQTSVDASYNAQYNLDNTGLSQDKIDVADLLIFSELWLCF